MYVLKIVIFSLIFNKHLKVQNRFYLKIFDLLNANDNLPKHCSKWEEKLGLMIDWKMVHESTLRNHEIKIRWFQIRITTRIICTNIMLKYMNLKNDDLCTFCNEETETIEHIFAECLFTLQFWNQVKALLLHHDIVQDNFSMSPSLILFCVPQNGQKKISKALFTFFQYAKYFVYKSRCEENIPIFRSFKKYFKKTFETQRYIAMKNYNLDRFESDWEKWKDLLEELL